MPKYTDFESFARDLYLTASNVPLDVRQTVNLDPTAFMERTEIVLEFFEDAHRSKIGRVLRKGLQNKVIRTDEEFMRYTIPKCLNLIDDERYFYSLMLVAAFINELQTFLYNQKRCYRFVLTGYKCLVAVFKRKFESGFEAHGGFKGLDKYFTSVSKAVRNRKKDYKPMTLLNGCDKDLIGRVADLIRSCDDGIDQDFLLNDYELSVAEDIEATKNEWFNPTVVENDPLFEFEWTLAADSTGTVSKLKSVYDKEKDLIKTTRAETGSPVGNDWSSDYRSELIPPPEVWPDSDVDSSGDSESEPDFDGIFEKFAFNCFNVMKPDEFDRIISSRQCQFCENKCHGYALYTFRKYGSLALRVTRPKWLKTIRNVVWKVKKLVRKTVPQ